VNYFVHNIDPIIFSIGSFPFAWYGFSYVISCVIGYIIAKKNFARKAVKISEVHFDTFMFCIVLGVSFGGRLGYVLFYQFTYYLQNPIEIFYTRQGGMSFHGGMLGVIIASLLFCKKYKYNFYTLADPTMPAVAVGVGLVRVANFVNGELYGRATTLPWAVIFRTDNMYPLPKNLTPALIVRLQQYGILTPPSHPSQLYESLLEGFLMAIFLQIMLTRTKINGLLFWLFITIYGVVRYLIEYIRLPDDIPMYDNGMLLGYFSMGQLLSLCMAITGAIFITILCRNKHTYELPTNKKPIKQNNKKK